MMFDEIEINKSHLNDYKAKLNNISDTTNEK